MSLKKIVIIVVVLLVVSGVVFGTIRHNAASVTAVSTTKVAREDLLSVVSGTGQIKPKTYVNIGATAFGRITHLYVKEGDHVKKGATSPPLKTFSRSPPSPPSRPLSSPRRPTSTPSSPPSRPPTPTSPRPRLTSSRRRPTTTARSPSTTRN